MIAITCDGKYCHRTLDLEDGDAKEWKSIEVKIDRSDTGVDIAIDVWPIDPEKLRMGDSFACPEHWRQVARKAVGSVEDLFPDPPRAPRPATPNGSPPSIDEQAAESIDPEKAF